MSQSMNSYPIRLLPVRQGAILRIIVGDYVTNAMPVGSEHIAKDHSLGVSPATIRNDMAALEEEGYIVHPYTSAGRIPSDKGYRYYIQVLMEEDPPQPATRKADPGAIQRLGGRAEPAHRSLRSAAGSTGKHGGTSHLSTSAHCPDKAAGVGGAPRVRGTHGPSAARSPRAPGALSCR